MHDQFDQLPYGAYLAGRDYVIFNRDYQPIVRVSPAVLLCHDAVGLPTVIPLGLSTVTACWPDERIEFDSQVWFYKDRNSPLRCPKTRARLKQIVDAIPELGAEIARRNTKVSA